ncbi:unnamed protein product, partial [Scytosiphon promiscuus]
KVEHDKQLEPVVDVGGRVVHFSAPKDGTTVRVSGRREGAAIQVVERLRPSYQLIISATVAASSLLSTGRKSGRGQYSGDAKIHSSTISPTFEGTKNTVAENIDSGRADATVAASLSLGKSEIKAALERKRGITPSILPSLKDGHHMGNFDLPSGPTTKISLGTSPGSTSRIVGHTSPPPTRPPSQLIRTVLQSPLFSWITTGRAPRRAHLIRWLLQRLELVQGAAFKDRREPDIEEGVQGRIHGAEGGAGWSLVISGGDVNGEKLRSGAVDDEGGNVGAEDGEDGAPRQAATSSGGGDVGGQDRSERQRPGGQMGEALREDGEESISSYRKTLVAPAANTVDVPVLTPEEHPAVAGEGEQQRWRWWDNENPWSRGSMSSATTRSSSIDGKAPRSGPALSPPAYREPVPPPPYREVTGGLSTSSESRSGPVRKSVSAPHEQHQRSPLSDDAAEATGISLRASPVASRDDASTRTSSEEDAGRGPPPSYRSVAATGGETQTSSSSARSAEDERENNLLVRDLPPPSYGRFYEPHGAAEWWAQDNQDESSEPERELEHRRRRRQVVLDDGSGSTGRRDEQHRKIRDRPFERPETVDDKEEFRRGAEPRGWQRSRRVVGRRASTAAGAGRLKAATAPEKNRQKGFGLPLTGTESWDDDRWRLTRYLQSCKKELTEAEEKRRRAEVAANAAERSAWKTARNSSGGDDDASKRAWARAATQRVLDLMLVTERVRQEEQKRRVAAARANSQVARCKQPFRERRGRSQKGPVIGPSVPPANYDTMPPRTAQRTEDTALHKFYWDEHGRRYARRPGDRSVGIDHDDAGHGDDISDDREEPPGDVGVAVEAVRGIAKTCLEGGTDFAQPFRDMDADGDGRLTLAELGAALRRAGARLSLSQVAALFRHFDEGLGLDTVGRGKFLWEFVNTRRLLKQWREAGVGIGGHRARTAPFRHRAKAALSYSVGSDGSALSRHDVLEALAEVGVHVDGWQGDALLDRFTVGAANGSEQVDWRALVSFLQAAEKEEDERNGNIHDKNPLDDSYTETYPGRRERPRNTALPRRDGSRGDQFPRRRRQQQLQPRERQKQHWATSGGSHRVGGGLFEAGGGPAATSRSRPIHPTAAASTTPTKPKVRTAPSGDDPSYTHWASSLPAPIGTRPKNNATVGAGRDVRKRGVSPSSGLDDRGGWTRGSNKGDAQRRRSESGFSMAAAAEASRVLDRLLEDQRELEAFLEEEFAKRE